MAENDNQNQSSANINLHAEVIYEHKRERKHYKTDRNYRTIKSGRTRNYNKNTGQVTNRNYRKIH